MVYVLRFDFSVKKLLKSNIKDKIFKKDITFWETRTCSEKKFNELYSEEEGLWLSVGTDHTVLKNGWIRRAKAIVNMWCIDINTNDDIIDLVSEFGDIDTYFYEPYNYIPIIKLK